jgi:hypothetical protein
MSPLSCMWSLNRAASLYTSYLFLYSCLVMEMLQRISPLCLRMPSYSCLLLDFDGHSITNRISPGGALTLLHPVVREKSCPRCFDRASRHCSRSPLYLRDYMSLEILLYMYNQHPLSGSTVFVVVLVLVGFHISVVGAAVGRVVFCVVVVVAGSLCFCGLSG